jgi:SAM-dependent methyltransferase
VNKEPLISSEDTGFSTLMNISEAHKLNTWMFEAIQPYLKGKTLEIGSGIGNISSVCIDRQIPLYLSDYNDRYCQLLKTKFGAEPNIKDIFRIDLADKDFEITQAHLLGAFDSIFALNVIEHIDDDQLAVANCHKLLTPGGRLILLMPAYPALYNRFDKELGHYRRYTGRSMNHLLSTNFQNIKIQRFNLAGIFGWFLFGSILRGKHLTREQMDAFEKMVPLFRLADKITVSKIGLSIIGVGEKKAPVANSFK